MTSRVLVVDDDADIRELLRITLEHADFAVDAAGDGVEAIERAHACVPDAIVLDLMMPRLDGMSTLERIRDDRRLQDVPVLLLTARAQVEDAVDGLHAGADDFVAKPFHPDELAARVDSAIRRSARQRARNPLSGLPGNEHIREQLARRIDAGRPAALLYADIDEFKAYNDHYGFLRGDDVIRATAQLLVDAVDAAQMSDTFVGHVGGDDFVLIAPVDAAESLAERVCAAFDDAAPTFYDPDDRDAGGLTVTDRRGTSRRCGLLTLSIGIATTTADPSGHPGELVAVATEVKQYLKGQPHARSQWMRDRRSTRSTEQ